MQIFSLAMLADYFFIHSLIRTFTADTVYVLPLAGNKKTLVNL